MKETFIFWVNFFDFTIKKDMTNLRLKFSDKRRLSSGVKQYLFIISE